MLGVQYCRCHVEELLRLSRLLRVIALPNVVPRTVPLLDFRLAVLVLGTPIDRIDDLACLLVGAAEFTELFPCLCLDVIGLVPQQVSSLVGRLMEPLMVFDR